MSGISTQQLTEWLDQTLHAARFKDYCPNGLQVEGKAQIRHIVTGVTASEALLRAAIEQNADAVLVHHGWFWRNEDARIIGQKRKRLALALKHDLNVLGYHLPLDAHPAYGNNAQLAKVLGLTPDRHDDGSPVNCGPDNLVWLGQVPAQTRTLGAFAEHVAQRLNRKPLMVGAPDQPVGRVAWCTGGAQGMLADAVAAGASVYITGEASESTTHLARESGVGFLGAGHHATERYGVEALGKVIANTFDVQVTFIDIDNPV